MVRAGDGGAGSAHLASEPYQPRAGADGGDGGAGGDVVLRVDAEVFDLSAYRDRIRHRAESGGAGGRNRRTGASGGDLVLAVPDGTVVSDERGVIADLVGAGASVVAVRGGRGGRGSASLSSARNRVPRAAEPGEEGEERRIELELRLGGRRRPGRSAQRREVHAARCDHGGQAEDRRLPLHHALAQPRGRRRRAPHGRRGRPRPNPRRPRGSRTWSRVPAARVPLPGAGVRGRPLGGGPRGRPCHGAGRGGATTPS